MTTQIILAYSIQISFLMVMLSLALAFVRLARGPRLSDRVVALDMMTTLIVSVCGIVAIRSGGGSFLDVALVLALVGFLATVALARYAERRDPENEDHADD
jgi:multicomponent Na+:H+ antiporter subunit F